MAIEINNLNNPVPKASTAIAVGVPGITVYCAGQNLVAQTVSVVLRQFNEIKAQNNGVGLILQGLLKMKVFNEDPLNQAIKISAAVESCLNNVDEKSVCQVVRTIPFCVTSAFAFEIFKNFKRTVSGEANRRIFFYDLIEGSYRGGFVGFSAGLAASHFSLPNSKNAMLITAATGSLLGSISGVAGTLTGKFLGSLYNQFKAPALPEANQ